MFELIRTQNDKLSAFKQQLSESFCTRSEVSEALLTKADVSDVSKAVADVI